MTKMDFHRLEYEARVQRVIEHIEAHVGEELSLERLARVAAFSPFHFHRIFRAITGETLFTFIQRTRLERAAAALQQRPDQSVLAIALDHGFASAATFARAFKAQFGVTASAWRTGGGERDSKMGKANRKPGKALGPAPAHGSSRSAETPMAVILSQLPEYRVACMRTVGPYGDQGPIVDLWKQLWSWMELHQLNRADAVQLGIAYDDPRITAPDKSRYDACVVVPDDFVGDPSVDLMTVHGGRFAITEFSGSAREVRDAWETFYGAWLPGSGFVPEDRPCFELYRGDPMLPDEPWSFQCQLCIPIKAL